MRVFFHGQSEQGPMTATVGDVCGWMVTDFSLIPIPLLITQISTLWLVRCFFLVFLLRGASALPFFRNFLLSLSFQIQPDPPTYHLAPTPTRLPTYLPT
jgi:hypothetical protein